MHQLSGLPAALFLAFFFIALMALSIFLFCQPTKSVRVWGLFPLLFAVIDGGVGLQEYWNATEQHGSHPWADAVTGGAILVLLGFIFSVRSFKARR